jgi:hypothetical protein
VVSHVLRTALALASRGLHILACRPRSKMPLTVHGLLDATRDAEVIKSWWRAEPTANVAVRTGAISGIIVIDVDGLSAERELDKLELLNEPLPETVETITARGRHVWFAHPGGTIPNSVGRVADGIDVRADNGFVLCPPSAHPSGRRYAWSVDCGRTIAAAPAWLLAKLAAPNGNGSAAPTAEWERLASGPIPEGTRNSTLTRLAGHQLRRYVNIDVVSLSLRGINRAFCVPPLPDADVSKIVNSVAGIELRRRGAS